MNNQLNVLESIFANTKKDVKKSLSEIRRFNRQISLDGCFIQDRLPLDLPRFPDKPKGSSARGIYMYSHISDAPFTNIRYVGKGIVNSRRDRFKRNFNNGGSACVSKNGASSDCRVAHKCREEDPNLGNWMMWIIRMPNLTSVEAVDDWTNHLEKQMSDHYHPRYNLPGMLGK